MIESEKKTIRKELKFLRNSLSEGERKNANSRICKTLCELDEVVNSERISAYMPYGNEVDLTSFFANFAKKKFVFPRYIDEPVEKYPGYEMVEVAGKVFTGGELKEFFVSGKYGILEPKKGFPVISEKDIDVWLIPGLGFDKTGNRLGMGGGIYDRLLSGVSGVKVGIGYDVQMIVNVPAGPDDKRMDLIITESQKIRC